MAVHSELSNEPSHNKMYTPKCTEGDLRIGISRVEPSKRYSEEGAKTWQVQRQSTTITPFPFEETMAHVQVHHHQKCNIRLYIGRLLYSIHPSLFNTFVKTYSKFMCFCLVVSQMHSLLNLDIPSLCSKIYIILQLWMCCKWTSENPASKTLWLLAFLAQKRVKPWEKW